MGQQSWTSGLQWEGKNPDDEVQFEIAKVNHDLIQTLGIGMAAGRPFSRDFATDSSTIILNEAAVQVMGLKDPVGKVVKLWGQDRQVIGVAKNFHFQSLHEKVTPLFFLLTPGETPNVVVKIAAGKEKAAIDGLRTFYEGYNRGFAFDYKFLSRDYQALYAAESRVAVLSRYFAGLAILISCLGLFGLAAFTAERRRKEIGIRKVLGSSELGIVRLLSGEFTKMVLTSVVIALPISYLLTKGWLERFAYRIPLEPWYFLLAGLLALLVALATVGVQALKAARANPVHSLKDE
jgi:ABC-type antimicrobial peptide transport system permease subunit